MWVGSVSSKQLTAAWGVGVSRSNVKQLFFPVSPRSLGKRDYLTVGRSSPPWMKRSHLFRISKSLRLRIAFEGNLLHYFGDLDVRGIHRW
mmetsp:Transcript_33227/g.40199  ORF Transcript_33227/g.40199 Transcript_33227/m.40199 type:complete len:90 (-) Transcript_33227:42-311(-)